jgi:hypothetical protein
MCVCGAFILCSYVILSKTNTEQHFIQFVQDHQLLIFANSAAIAPSLRTVGVPQTRVMETFTNHTTVDICL